MTQPITLPPAERVKDGVYDIGDDNYFALHSRLSSTGVKEILQSPARFRHNQLNPRPPKREFDVGHAFHTLVLGEGPQLVVVDAEEWRTKAVKEEVAEHRAAGRVPLRPSDFAIALGMNAAVRAHPIASKLFTGGVPERALLWVDKATGVACRAKPDWLRPDGLVDLKSCDRADVVSLRKAVWNFGYCTQAPWYLRGLRATRGVDGWFAFVAVEKDPPHLVHVFQLTERALAYGDRRCVQALEIYRDCTAAGEWPGYPLDEITEIDLPGWVRDEEW